MEDKIKEIMKKEFQAETLEIKRITEGYSHSMFIVNIDKEPYEVIIRFSNNSHKKWATLGKEKFVLETMSEKGIPVPKILAYNSDRKEGYLILEKLKGTRLDTIWDNLPNQEKSQIAEEIGKIMKQIHSIKLNEFGLIEEGGNIDSDEPFRFKAQGEAKEYSESIRQRLKDFFKDASIFLALENTKKEFALDLIKYISENVRLLDHKEKPVLTHGDLMPGHLFVEKRGENWSITGLIDVEFAESAAPEYDFIKLHRAGFFNNPDIKNSLVKGYGNINEKAVELQRLIRDFQFANVLIISGNENKASEILLKIKEAIKSSNNSYI